MNVSNVPSDGIGTVDSGNNFSLVLSIHFHVLFMFQFVVPEVLKH